MRYTDEVSIRFIGDQELGKQYIPLGRKILGGVVNRDSHIGGLEQSRLRRRFSNGLFIDAGYIGTQPYISIDVSGMGGDKKDIEIPVFAVFPQGMLNNPFTTSDLPGYPVAPSTTQVGITLERGGAVGKYSSSYLAQAHKFINPITRRGRLSELDWYSNEDGRLYCIAYEETDKWHASLFTLDDGSNDRIFYRGFAVLDLRFEHPFPTFYTENFICGMGVYGNQLIYMTRPKNGEPDRGVVSVWSRLLQGEGVQPGVRPLVAVGESPVLIGTHETDDRAEYGLSLPWSSIGRGYRCWYHFAGSGTKAVRLQELGLGVVDVNGDVTTTQTTLRMYREELTFTKDMDGNVQYTRSTAQVSEMAGVTVVTDIDNDQNPPTVYNPVLFDNPPSNSKWTSSETGSFTSDTHTENGLSRNYSLTGNKLIACDYERSETEALITLEIEIVSSVGTSSELHLGDTHTDGQWNDWYKFYPPGYPPPYDTANLYSQVTNIVGDATWEYQLDINIETNLVYKAYGQQYTLPYTNLTNTYNAIRTYERRWVRAMPEPGEQFPSPSVDINEWKDHTTNGSVDMYGQQQFLSDTQGSFSAADLREGIFVVSAIESSETVAHASAPDPDQTLSDLTMTREDTVYLCQGGNTESYALPTVEGIGTAGRPVYSYSDASVSIGTQPFPGALYWNEGMRCRTVRGSSGSNPDSSVSIEWVLRAGVNGRFDTTQLGVGGSIAVAPGEAYFISVTSYSMEVNEAGWSPYAVLPQCKQAAYIISIADGINVYSVTEKMWRGHEYGTFVSTPSETALIGSVEWAGMEVRSL